MNDELKKKLTEAHESLVEKVTKVGEVFSDFFGEEHVDLQNVVPLNDFIAELLPTYTPNNENIIKDLNTPTIINTYFSVVGSTITPKILIHFPEVTVTNEYNKSITIQDLYVYVKVEYDGTISGTFTMNRATYSYDEFTNDYMHSHIPGIPKNFPRDFLTPCLGYGPIRITINNLAIKYDLDLWGLFCFELKKFIETESVSGIPYRKLENVSKHGRIIVEYNKLHYNMKHLNNNIVGYIDEFIIYFIEQNKLEFSYNNSFALGMSFKDYMILVTNCFIEWFNNKYKECQINLTLEYLLSRKILMLGYFKDNSFVKVKNENVNTTQYSPTEIEDFQNSTICTFKGKTIKTKVLENFRSEDLGVYPVLDIQYASYIINRILEVLNYRYGKEENTTRGKEEEIGIKERILFF